MSVSIKQIEAEEFKGVYWKPMHRRFKSAVSIKGKEVHCGYFETAREAAKGRDRKILAFGLNVELQVLKKL